MKNQEYEFTQNEREYAREIYKLIKELDYPELFYVVGIEKDTGRRAIFLYKETNGELYILSEILDSESNISDRFIFEFSSEDDGFNINYEEKKPWWQRLFWR